MSHYSYRYVNDKGVPLSSCPACGHLLLAIDSVVVECSSGFNNWDIPSRLDANGRLVDHTQRVGRADHSTTRCGSCREQLINMDGVEEIQERT